MLYDLSMHMGYVYDQPASVARHVIRVLPLSLPGIIAGSMLVFIPAIGEFVIQSLLGGPETLMIGRVLWDEFFTNANWPRAAAVACAMLLVVVVPVVVVLLNGVLQAARSIVPSVEGIAAVAAAGSKDLDAVPLLLTTQSQIEQTVAGLADYGGSLDVILDDAEPAR